MSEEAVLDARFAALPRLFRDATNPNATAADVRRFMDELICADPALFCCALQFLSREGQGFVLVHAIGDPDPDARSWPRWPLRRLFASRRASLITNPVSERHALAVPFMIGSERHVAVAPLREQDCNPSQQAFLDTLQSVTMPSARVAAASERIPRFAWLGAHARLGERLGSLARRRAWPLVCVPTFGNVLVMLEQDQIDVVLLEARALQAEFSSLRALRHAAKIGDAPIVYFIDRDPGPEIRTLVDCCLPTNSDEAELLRALKASAALVFRTRKRALHANVQRMEHRLRCCSDLPELAQSCAEAALLLGADAASVMLADELGGVHAAHAPINTVLGDHWPTPFMTGEVITRTHATDVFFEEAFDNAEYARHLRTLDPVSAAALPIATGTDIVGSLVAFSTIQPMFQPEFDALSELCARTARIVSSLREPRRSTRWRDATLGESRVEAFEGQKARASVCVRSDDENVAIVILERENDRRAAALAELLLLAPQANLHEAMRQCKEDARGMLLAVMGSDDLRFAVEGLPLPLRVPVSGPVPAARRIDSCETGTIPVDGPAAILLCSNEFAAQIATAQLVGAVQHALRNNRAGVARSLPGLGPSAQRLAFVCVTTLSSGVELPRPSALV
ncbi:MAG TPA: GAF domain-containing protein [Candidatus Baltobacteraceae bacterium]|nr:GAF domain-containing protein [Candidatus Baltobacteraceae bacterium]